MLTISVFHKVRALLLGALALALALGSAAGTAASAFAQEEPPSNTLPEPGVRWGGGVVTAIGAGSFSVHTRRGRDANFIVDADTVFFNAAGRPAALADLTVGARVAGSVEVRADGTHLALLVVIFPPQTRYVGVGVVTSLEPDAFHFVSRRGQVWEFYVDAGTTFTSHAGETLSLADLEVETRAFVRSELREDGEWWAVEVKVGR